MKKLNKLQSIIFSTGALLMVVSTFMFVLKFQAIQASIVFIIGSIAFTVMQNMQTYEGTNPTIKRLRSIMSMGDLFFILAGIFMLDTAMTNAAIASPEDYTVTLFRQFFNSHIDYLTYIYNKWLPLLMIAVMLEVYSTLRISSELKKEGKQ